MKLTMLLSVLKRLEGLCVVPYLLFNFLGGCKQDKMNNFFNLSKLQHVDFK
jgi:hypothetical protein